MGSAVSSVTNLVQGLGSNPFQQLGNAVGGVTGGIAGGAIGGLVEGLIPQVPIADQSGLQNQINNQQSLGQTYQGQQAQQQQAANNFGGEANSQINYVTPQAINQAQGAIGQAQGAVQNAQQVNQGPGSNVQNAIGLVGQTAAGGGAAQEAAGAQLQRGTDQAIATQQAMANSGNLSQMIGGQRNAMQNAAQLQQQNALNAASLQAGMAGTAQGQYAGAAGQQASQAAANAGLQQNQTSAQQGQTAAQQQQAAQMTALSGQANNAAQGYAGQANTAAGNAMTGQTNALGIQQQALGQTSQYRAQALGGMMNAAGGVLASSDENGKYDIQYAGRNPSGNMGGPNGSGGPGMPDERPEYAGSQYDKSGQTPTSSQLSPEDRKAAQAKIGSAFSGMGQGTNPNWQIIPVSSDENGKKEISHKDKIGSFLDAIDPVSFKYKEADGTMGKTPGEHLGVIAQQIEKAPGGKSMVVDTPKGKAIDLASAVGTLLAAAAETHDRVKDLEEFFKSRSEAKKKKS